MGSGLHNCILKVSQTVMQLCRLYPLGFPVPSPSGGLPAAVLNIDTRRFAVVSFAAVVQCPSSSYFDHAAWQSCVPRRTTQIEEIPCAQLLKYLLTLLPSPAGQ